MERIDTAATQPIDCGIYMEFVVQNSNMNSAVNKVYKNTLLTAGEVSFPVSLGIGEDGIFNLKCAARCHKVVYIPATFYVYCYGESEFTSGKLRNKTGRLNETIRGFEERKSIIDEYCNKSKVSEERVKKLERLHEDYMIEQLYHQAKGVKANVGSSAFKEYVKNNSAMREACWHLILRGTNMKRKILFPQISGLMHGGDYNPEQWLDRPDILEADVQMMKEAGMNVRHLAFFHGPHMNRKRENFISSGFTKSWTGYMKTAFIQFWQHLPVRVRHGWMKNIRRRCVWMHMGCAIIMGFGIIIA